jgi:hypothetical protein
MKASSLSLAAALILTTLNPASAGFAGVPPRPSFAPRAPFARHANTPAAFRSGPVGANDFRHFRRGFWPVFPAFFPNAAPSGDASTDVDRPAVFNAPSYSTTIVIAAPQPQYAYAAAPAYATFGGPKIIRIGAPPRSAAWRKMPIVVYGSTIARSY